MAGMEIHFDSGRYLQKNVIVKQYILDHAVRSPSLRSRKEWVFFFCRVQFHRELLKKKKENISVFTRTWLQSKWQTLFLPFLSLPFNLQTLNQNQGHLVIYSVRVWRERSCFNYIKFYKLCIKKKLIITSSTVHSPNFTSNICSSPTPFIISQTKYQNPFCYIHQNTHQNQLHRVD